MPIYVASALAARNGGTYYLVDDNALKGGYQVRATTAERDSIEEMNRKAGMLVFTVDTGKIWVLGNDLTTWGSLNQTINTVSQATAGLMSSSDKTALDALVTSALSGMTVNAPLVTTGGKTPTISLPSSSSSQDGYLKASDWIVFNSKGNGNGTVTAVTASSPVQSSGGTSPVISMPPASASTHGYLTKEDWNTFNSKASATGSVAAVTGTAPIVSSGGTNPVVSMPAATSSNDGYLKATDWVIFNSKGNGTLQAVQANAPLVSTGGVNPTISMPAASSSANGYLRATDWVTFNSKGNGNVNTVGVQSPLLNSGTVTDPVITMPAATSTAHGYMTNADKAKLDGIAANANAYVHPSTDGNLHVPATGAASEGMVLTAGPSAGSMSWKLPSGAVASVNGKTGAVVLTAADLGGLKTTDNAQFASLGIGTAASGLAGEIRATNNITGFYSSDRNLKENITPIEDALNKVLLIDGVEFDWTDAYIEQHGGEDDYFNRKHDVGVIAQDLQAVLPEVVATRPDGTLAVKYDRISALLIQAIKELSAKMDAIREEAAAQPVTHAITASVEDVDISVLEAIAQLRADVNRLLP